MVQPFYFGHILQVGEQILHARHGCIGHRFVHYRFCYFILISAFEERVFVIHPCRTFTRFDLVIVVKGQRSRFLHKLRIHFRRNNYLSEIALLAILSIRTGILDIHLVGIICCAVAAYQCGAVEKHVFRCIYTAFTPVSVATNGG